MHIDMARRFGFALIGLGRHARSTHSLNMMCHPQIDLKYVVEHDTDMARQFLKQHNREDIKVVLPSDINSILEDKSVHATVICALNKVHEEYIKCSVKAGKAVFCEKPVTPDLASTMSCFEEAKRNRQPLFCGFNRRFDPSISSLYRRIQAGEVGQIKCIRTLVRDHELHPIEYLRTSGGIFADSVVHEFDLIVWFMKSLPLTVYAQGHAWREELREFGDVDHANIVMKFPDGTIVNIDAGRFTAYGNDHRMEIHGTNGVCIERNAVYPTSLTSLGQAGELKDNRYDNNTGLWKQSFVNELQHFVNVLEGKEDVLVMAEECANTATIITACNESYKTGLPVHL